MLVRLICREAVRDKMTARLIQRLTSPTGLRAFGLFVVALCTLVLIGHLTETAALQRLLPRQDPIAANLALGCLLAGAALSLLVSPRSATIPMLGYIPAAALFVLAAVPLIEYLAPTGYDLDRVLFRGIGKDGGRMQEASALVLVQIGAALLLLRSRRLHWLCELLA